MSENCIFCKIANGEIPAPIIYQTPLVIVFNDIDPQAPQHLLVVPKAHIESLNELEDGNLMGELFAAVGQTVKKLDIKEYRSVINTGKSAGQEVMHLHIHILSGRDFIWPPG